MRKYLAILFISFLILGVSSCGNSTSCAEKQEQKEKSPKEKFRELAEKGLADFIDKYAVNSETYKVKNLKTLYLSDSLCVLHFKAIAENNFGGTGTDYMQYFFIKDGDKYFDKLEETSGDLEKPDISWMTDIHESLIVKDNGKNDLYNFPRYKQIKDGDRTYLRAWLLLTDVLKRHEVHIDPSKNYHLNIEWSADR